MTSLRRPFLASRGVLPPMSLRSEASTAEARELSQGPNMLPLPPFCSTICRRSLRSHAGTEKPQQLALGIRWHQHPSQGETRPRPLRQCQETRVFRDPVDAKMSLPSQDTLPTTCKRAEFGVLQASNPTKQELLLIENVPQALSFKCLRQFSIKSNSRFVSIVLLPFLYSLFVFRNMSRNHFTPPTLHCSAAMSCML